MALWIRIQLFDFQSEKEGHVGAELSSRQRISTWIWRALTDWQPLKPQCKDFTLLSLEDLLRFGSVERVYLKNIVRVNFVKIPTMDLLSSKNISVYGRIAPSAC